METTPTSNKLSPILISIFCIGIIFFILFTQCEVSNIKLKPKDASLVLIFLALIAYINNYNLLFLVLLGTFIFLYFGNGEYINKLISGFFKKENDKPKSIIKKPKKVRIEEEHFETPEITIDTDLETTTDNEITIDTDIDLDDNIDEPQNTNGDVYMMAKKQIN